MIFHFYYFKNFIMISFHYLTNSNEVTAERENALIYTQTDGEIYHVLGLEESIL